MKATARSIFGASIVALSVASSLVLARDQPQDPVQVGTARQRPPDPRVGTQAKAFSFETPDGLKVSLESLAGRVVLLDFWATWCKPCLMSTPSLTALSERLKNEPFALVAISADRSREPWEKYLKENPTNWLHYLDEQKTILKDYEVSAYPTYMLLDHKGVIRYARTGWGPSRGAEIERETLALVKAVPR
jgi:thiol-disulfide isomerase/thioredoxin